MIPRFQVDYEGKTYVVYADGPSSASALFAKAKQLPRDIVPGASIQPAGWYDADTNTIVGNPDAHRVEYGVAWPGSRV